MLVSDDYTGNLYTVDAASNTEPFATLLLPRGYVRPGLRQFAWAPSGFAAGGTDYSGDLFVSVAAQDGGGGTTGDIDVLNASGDTLALYVQGGGAIPLDPRGLDFVGPTTLLVANADPSVDSLSPTDFEPAAEALAVPEPASFGMLALGLVGLAGVLRRARR